MHAHARACARRPAAAELPQVDAGPRREPQRRSSPAASPDMASAGAQGKNKCPLKAPSDQEFGEICHPGATGHAGGAEQPVYRCPRPRCGAYCVHTACDDLRAHHLQLLSTERLVDYAPTFREKVLDERAVNRLEELYALCCSPQLKAELPGALVVSLTRVFVPLVVLSCRSFCFCFCFFVCLFWSSSCPVCCVWCALWRPRSCVPLRGGLDYGSGL